MQGWDRAECGAFGGTRCLRAAQHDGTGALPERDLSQWMIDALAHMSPAETVALSAIIAAALAFLWHRHS